MLEGITVLSETVHQFSILNEIGIICISLFIAFCFAVFAILTLDNRYVALTIGLIKFIFFVFLFNITIDNSVYSTYKVTISEDVKYIEFTNRYEVISQDGDIYEIREKETE